MPRTYVAGDRTRIAGDFNVYTRIEVYCAGAWRDITNYTGARNWLVEAKWKRALDAPVMTGTLTLLKECLGWSIAPLVTGSPMNTLSGSYGALLASGNAVRISTNSAAFGAAPVAGDWKEMFLGRIDDPDVGGDDGTLTCTISCIGAWLMDQNIDTERTYAVATGTALETVIQSILTDNPSGPLNTLLGSAVTLSTPVSPAWNVKTFKQAKVNVLDAIRTLAQQIGWDVRFVYSAANVYTLTLFQPQRTKVIADYTLTTSDYYEVPQAATLLGDIRTRIGGSYIDAATKARLWRYVQSDAAHTNQYGIRYMDVQEDASSNIDSATQMDAMLNAILSDLQDLAMTHVLNAPYFWLAELGDLVQHNANGVHYDVSQNLAVVAIEHTLNAAGESTQLTTRGKPAGSVKEWIARQGDGTLPAGAPPVPSLSFAAQSRTQYNINLDAILNVTTGLGVQWQTRSTVGGVASAWSALSTTALPTTTGLLNKDPFYPTYFELRVYGGDGQGGTNGIIVGPTLPSVDPVTGKTITLYRTTSGEDVTSDAIAGMFGASGANVLTNGGGQDGALGPTQASGWTFNAGNALTCATDQSKIGGRSLKLDHSAGANNSSSYQNYSVNAGDVWEVSGWIRVTAQTVLTGAPVALLNTDVVSGAVTALLAEAPFIANGIDIGLTVSGSLQDWTFVRTLFQVTASGTMRTYCQLGGGGTTNAVAWFDDVTIKRVASTVSVGGVYGYTGLDSAGQQTVGVRDQATVGSSGQTAFGAAKMAGTGVWQETFDSFPAAANGGWVQVSGARPGLSPANTGSTKGKNVIGVGSGGEIDWPTDIALDPRKLYRMRCRYYCTADGGVPANQLMYVGVRQYKADGTNANTNGGVAYVCEAGYNFTVANAGAGRTATGWFKAGLLVNTSFPVASIEPRTPSLLNVAAVTMRPMILYNWSTGTGFVVIDYLDITEYDEDGTSRTYNVIDSTNQLFATPAMPVAVGTPGTPGTLSKTVRINSESFTLNDSTQGYSRDGSGLTSANQIAGTDFRAPVYLPRGATVTAVRFRLNTVASTGDFINVQLAKYNDTGTVTSIVGYNGTLAYVGWGTQALSCSETLVTGFNYVLSVNLNNSISGGSRYHKFLWVELDYTIPDYAKGL